MRQETKSLDHRGAETFPFEIFKSKIRVFNDVVQQRDDLFFQMVY